MARQYGEEASDAFRGAVAARDLGVRWRRAVKLYQLAVIDIGAEGFI
jgi:hypothetical protein